MSGSRFALKLSEAPKRFIDGETSGFFMLKSGKLWVLSGAGLLQMTADFHATGSGFEIAMGALAMGATAEKAVEIASIYDQASGGGVDYAVGHSK